MMELDPSDFKPRLRDGVDVYLEDDTTIVFVYLASRKRLTVRCHPLLAQALALMTGECSVAEMEAKLGRESSDPLPPLSLQKFVSYLKRRGLLVPSDWLERSDLPPAYVARLTRQLYFLLDILEDPNVVLVVQRQIHAANVVVFGVGAVGSWLCRELVMLGFSRFRLVDPDSVEEADLARHAFAPRQFWGKSKCEVVKNAILQVDPEAVVAVHPEPLTPRTDLRDLLKDADIVINTADEPYIGHTSIALSRYCVRNGIPLLIAGGFDAHLGSVGELIVPGVTPCADCYSAYFDKALEGWKPYPHPVSDRRDGFGGLAPLAAFAASTGALMVLRYFINRGSSFAGGRSELQFEDYSMSSFSVERDPDCVTCGGLRY